MWNNSIQIDPNVSFDDIIQNELESLINDRLIERLVERRPINKMISPSDKKLMSETKNILNKLLIEDNIDVDYLDANNNNLPLLICGSGIKNIFDTIALKIPNYFQQHFIADHINNLGNTVLIEACKHNMTDFAMHIITKHTNSCLPGHINSCKKTALIYACGNQMFDFIDTFSKLCGINCSFDHTDHDKNNALMILCNTPIKNKKNNKCILNFLNKYRNKCGTSQINVNNFTPLIYACWYKNNEIVSKLIEIGDCNPSLKCTSGDTALLWLTFNDMPIQSMQLINKYGVQCNIDATDNSDSTSLIFASKHGRADVVNKLIELKCNIKYVSQCFGTALLCACRKNKKKVALILLETGKSNSSYIDKHQCDAMMLAYNLDWFDVMLKIIQFTYVVTPLQSEKYTDIISNLIKNQKHDIAYQMIDKFSNDDAFLHFLNNKLIDNNTDEKLMFIIIEKIKNIFMKKMVNCNIIHEDSVEYVQLNKIYNKIFNDLKINNTSIVTDKLNDNIIDDIYTL
jgi:ankyrin repeat protein